MVILVSPSVWAESGGGALPASPNTMLNLYDAFGYQRKGTVLDWGFSLLIHYNGRTILFDTGNSEQGFEHNVRALGVDLKQVDLAVLSHRHADHTSGFAYLMKLKPQVAAYAPDDTAFGAPGDFTFSRESAEQLAGVPPEQLYFGGKTRSMHYHPGSSFDHADMHYVGKTTQIAPGIHLVFTRSALMGDFSAYPPAEPGHPDLEGLPEISLALETSKGLVLITGCSHSKVEEIVRTAKRDLKQNVDTVVGGFHLFPYDAPAITRVAHTLKDELGVRVVGPAHCTGNLAFKIFRDLYGEQYRYAGVEAEVEFEH